MFLLRDLHRSVGLLMAILLAVGSSPSALAKTRKGDKLFKLGQEAEKKKDYDAALQYYEQAYATDPNDAGYRILLQRTRFYSSQKHVDAGNKLRQEGKLDEALAEFMKAIQMDASSAIAAQEWRRTQEMIEREKEKASKPEERGLTPYQKSIKETEDRISSMVAPPELKPVNRAIQSLKMNNQPPRVLYETVCKLAGLNVVFDPQYQNTSGRQNYNVDLNNSTVENALDYLGVLTKTFWKPLTENTIFVAEDNVTKRRDYEDDVVKVFYVTNATSVQEFQEIATAVRSLTEIRRVFTYNAQKAMLVRGTVDQVALAEKLIRDLDKPKAEVVIDVVVMEANRGRTRDLATAIQSGGATGIKLPVTFTPRSALTTAVKDADGNETTSSGFNLTRLNEVRAQDFATTLPSMLLQAMLTDRSTRVMQSPQVRASDGQKVSLRIGDKIPIATGSFQPGFGGAVGGGVSPLVSTQFNFVEVGVNVDITPQVHGTDEVTLKVSVEISTVRDRVDLGGISQPIIGQRKSETELRMKEGEVNILGGLTNSQDSRLISGIPGLVNVPILGRLFGGSENVERTQQELLIAMVPRIVRTPGYTPDNLRAVYAGNDQVVRVNFAPKKEPAPAPVAAPPKPAPVPVQPPPASTAPAATPGPVNISFAPGGEIQASPGSMINLSLQVIGIADLAGASPVKIKYDASKLRLNDAAQGEFIGRDGQRVSVSKDIRNDSGEATITVTRAPGSPGIGGSGAFLNLSFQAVGRGESRVSVEEVQFKDSKSQPIAATTTQVLVKLQ